VSLSLSFLPRNASLSMIELVYSMKRGPMRCQQKA
jgi:hypothetical protein